MATPRRHGNITETRRNLLTQKHKGVRLSAVSRLVRTTGLEPARAVWLVRASPPEPKSGASTCSATSAKIGGGVEAQVASAPFAFCHVDFAIISTLPPFLFPRRPEWITRFGLLSPNGIPFSTAFSASSAVVCTWPSSRSSSSRLPRGVPPFRLARDDCPAAECGKRDFCRRSQRVFSSSRIPRSDASRRVSASSRVSACSRSAEIARRRSCKSFLMSRIDYILED